MIDIIGGKMKKDIKTIVLDIDGSLTDGKIYMGNEGESVKAFSIKDGYAVKHILLEAGIEPVIITGRTSRIVENRCKEIGIEKIYQGRSQKLSTLKEIAGGELDTCAYFGDDSNDLECMLNIKAVGGLVGCPADAVDEVKAIADFVSTNIGGQGALREFSEWLVEDRPEVLPKKFSVVVSVYNEELGLRQFYEHTSPILAQASKDTGWDYELIFVNDGSRDASLDILRSIASEDDKVKVVNFAANRGHEAAMIAGIDQSTGDGVVCMDADLQHPPESIPAIIGKFKEGYDVVSMVRTQRDDASIFKKITSSAFYKVMNKMSKANFENNSSDFFGISRRVALVLKKDYRERVRFLRGYVQNVGFKKTTLEFKASARIAGESNYNLKALVKLSLNAICNFSDAPLKMGIYAGLVSFLFAFIVIVYSIVQFCIGNDIPSGYTTLVILISFMFGVLFIILGFISEYLAIIFAEVKNRPIYIVDSIITKNGEEKQE